MPQKRNRNELTDEQRVLVEDNHNLIYAYASRNNLTLDDWYGVLAYALCKAAQDYIPERGHKISTVAWAYFGNEVRKEKHLELMPKRSKKVETPIDDIPATMRQSEEEGYERVDDEDAYQRVIDCLKILRPREKEYLMQYVDGKSYLQIADEKKVSRQAVAETVKRARLKLRQVTASA